MKQILIIALLISSQAFGQLTDYNEQRFDTDKKLMFTLGSWAGANFIAGGVGWSITPESEAKYFHQMNVLWNTVNAALAIPGYLSARKGNANLSYSETIQAQHRTEKVFLINTGLDIGYMAGGLLLRSYADRFPERQNIMNGYGSSLILQGGFLFVFDLTAYFIHNRHRKGKLTPLLDNLSMSSTGIGLRYRID